MTKDGYYRHEIHDIVRLYLAFIGRRSRCEDVQLFVASENAGIKFMCTAALIQPQQNTQTHPSTQIYAVTHAYSLRNAQTSILHIHTVYLYECLAKYATCTHTHTEHVYVTV